MDDDAESAREYERLRAELAEFVLGVLTERLAAGDEPKLSQALIDAIDRRVEAAVAARAGSGGIADTERPTRSTRRAPPPNESWFTRGRIAVLAIGGLALIAVIAFFVVRTLPSTTTTSPRAPATNEAVFNVENGQITPENGSAPANAAGPNPPALPLP